MHRFLQIFNKKPAQIFISNVIEPRVYTREKFNEVIINYKF